MKCAKGDEVFPCCSPCSSLLKAARFVHAGLPLLFHLPDDDDDDDDDDAVANALKDAAAAAASDEDDATLSARSPLLLLLLLLDDDDDDDGLLLLFFNATNAESEEQVGCAKGEEGVWNCCLKAKEAGLVLLGVVGKGVKTVISLKTCSRELFIFVFLFVVRNPS